MVTPQPNAPSSPVLRYSSRRAFEQRIRRPVRGRGIAVANSAGVAVGFLREPFVREAGYIFGDLDVAALAGLPRQPARYEGGGGPTLPAGDQSIDRPRLALHARGRRVSGLAVLRGRGIRREQSLVDCDARRYGLFTANQLLDATGRAGR